MFQIRVLGHYFFASQCTPIQVVMLDSGRMKALSGCDVICGIVTPNLSSVVIDFARVQYMKRPGHQQIWAEVKHY